MSDEEIIQRVSAWANRMKWFDYDTKMKAIQTRISIYTNLRDKNDSRSV